MRIRHISVAAAVTLIAPVLTVLPPDAFHATARPAPVETSETQVALQDPGATTGDGDVVSRDDLALARTQARQSQLSARATAAPAVLEVSPEQAVPADLTVMGVSWAAGSAADTVVQYRARTAAGWGGWEAVDSEGDGGEAGTSVPGARAGSDPIVVTGATHVQVRVLGSAGQDPVDARLTLIDPKNAAADASAGSLAPGSAAAAAATPWINSRAAWGADESIRKDSPAYGQVRGAVVHHTAGTNDYTQAQVPAILRGIYAFHVKDRGWSDIGYNFLVDKWGRIWEGRYGGTDRAVIGAHAAGVNSQTTGISVMGDYNAATVSTASVQAVTRIIAWKAGVHGFNPAGRTTLSVGNVPVVTGHRDVGSTSCPGTSLYARLPAIRASAAALAGSGGGSSSSSSSSAAAPAGTGGVPADNVLMRSRSNALFASAPAGSDLGFARRVSAAGWGGFNTVFTAGDMNRDGYGDIIARHGKTAQLRLFTGKADGSLNPPVVIGTRWRNLRSLTGGADFTGDGRPDVVAIDARGVLRLYPGAAGGKLSGSIAVGDGWGSFGHVAALGDWDGDGKADLLGIRKDGNAFIYRGTGRGALRSGAIALPGKFSGFRAVTGLVGRDQFAAVTPAGVGVLVTRTGPAPVSRRIVTPSFRGLTVFGG